MKKFLIKILLFGIPAYFYAALIILIDPFNYFAISRIADDSTKMRVSYAVNPVLKNLLDYKNKPFQNVTISDSRFAHKDLDCIKKCTGQDFVELYAHDGLIQEFISFFNFADALADLRNVYFCLNFSTFTDSKRDNLVESAKKTTDNPLLYFINRNVSEATFLILLNKIKLSNESDLSKPKMDRKAFWQELLNTTELRFYKNYTYPEKYTYELKKIGEYCRQKNINLFFIIPPTNTDMQRLIDKNNLRPFRDRFVRELSEISVVYDMDFENPWTSNPALYLDPNHIYKENLTSLFEYIVNGKPDSLKQYVRILRENDTSKQKDK